MTLRECPRCGAGSPGPHCDYCGAPLASADPAAERAALDQLHSLLAGRSPHDDDPVALLARAFLPDHTQVLIEAGLRCVALLGEGSQGKLANALVGRLEAVAAKLRLDPSPESLRAAAELDRHLERFRSTRSRNLAVGVGALLALVGGLVWLVALVARVWRGR